MRKTCTIAFTLWLEVLRRKDLYVLIILLGALLVALVSLNIFGLGGTVRYVQDLGLLMAWLFGWILAVNVSSRQLPQEETRGTIFPLLAKPVNRMELVLGKWLGSWTIVVVATMMFYGLLVLVVLAKGGRFDTITLIEGFLLHCAALSVITAIGIAFSTRMNHDAAASISYVLTGASFLVVPRVPEFLAQERGITAFVLTLVYNALPHFEVLDMRKRIVHDGGPAAWNVFLIAMAYAAVLTAFFLLAAWLAYRRKRFSRAELL
jgi:ABC-type transport system involved in multi-copper enzyme maturation permease subunit